MWLVADSGSTKTDWVFFDKNTIHTKIQTPGLNPLFTSEEEIHSIAKQQLAAELRQPVTNLWFYGAGCESSAVSRQVVNALQPAFVQAHIQVNSDLLATAQATCGKDAGLVGIVGTGSNTGLFDGASITTHIKPLGYILGDEGSGTALGKTMLTKLLRDEFNAPLTQQLFSHLGLTYEQILQKVYHTPYANRFIASCTKWVHHYQDEPAMQQLIYHELTKFARLLKKYNSSLPISLSGSVAYAFKPQLQKLLQAEGLVLKRVIKAPIDGLVRYHQQAGLH